MSYVVIGQKTSLIKTILGISHRTYEITLLLYTLTIRCEIPVVPLYTFSPRLPDEVLSGAFICAGKLEFVNTSAVVLVDLSNALVIVSHWHKKSS